MTFRLDGLQSGLDTTSMIQQILESERIPYVRKENEIAANEDKIYAWSQLETDVNTLHDAADKLRSYLTWRQKKANSDDETILTASATRDASNASYSITVNWLAQAHRIASDAQADTTSALGLSGDFTIEGQTVSVSATDSLADIRDAINTAANNMSADQKVQASIINTTLVIERVNTGSTNIAITDGTGNVLQSLGVLDSGGAIKNELQQAKDLSANINGVDVTSSSNTNITSFISGVTLNFHKAGTTTLEITNDKDSIRSLIDDFITAYNDAMSTAESASAVNISSQGGTDSIDSIGLLQSDQLVYEIRSRARRIVTSIDTTGIDLDPNYNSLQKIGIWTTGEDNRLAVVDEDALEDALTNHFDEVEDLFRDSTAGIMTKMESYTYGLIGPVDGQIVKRKENLEEKNKDLQAEIDAFDLKQIDREQELYEMFARMESRMAEIQSQASYVFSSLGIKS